MFGSKKTIFVFAAFGISVAGFFLFSASGVSDWGFFESLIYVSGIDPSGELAGIAVHQEDKIAHLATPDPLYAIYMTSWVAGTRDWRSELIDFVDKSEINAIIIDVKDYSGKISFEVADPALKEFGAEEKRIPDIREFIKELHKKNIYAIARISVFQDLHMAAMRPDLAVKNNAGATWKDRKGLSWIDPAAREYWEYILKIAHESERAGFDELNFDYIRFPSDGNMKDIIYTFWDGKKAQKDVMLEFFSFLDARLADANIPISADLFGLVTTAETHDLNIGQVLEYAAPYFDYLAPMVYPSHYPPGFNGLADPAASPYEVIHYSMSKAYDRLLAATSTPSKLRPWIQDFDLGADYDAGMIQKQKQAIYDSGLTSWMAWDPANIYTKEAYYSQ